MTSTYGTGTYGSGTYGDFNDYIVPSSMDSGEAVGDASLALQLLASGIDNNDVVNGARVFNSEGKTRAVISVAKKAGITITLSEV